MSRFEKAVPTATFEVAGVAYPNRKMGHVAIFDTVCQYDGVGPFIEEFLDGLIDMNDVRKWIAGRVAKGETELTKDEIKIAQVLATKVLARIEAMDLTIGGVVWTIIYKFPGLIAELLLRCAVLNEDEGDTEDKFLAFIDARSLPEMFDLCLQWYRFQLEDDLRPFVEKAKAKAVAAAASVKDAAKPDSKPAKAPSRTASKRRARG
ncbi:hypothetical protein [Devosia faecipullorum]|uniref:hypothetical protein n=1 Tax=Devosia faecipullorum TaxID=2755039 RepID=UPI00187B3199|nr:hypothetical protein [Devosia faecipullorum]MBE7732176.1 hypothetical protein [Devosia faecipullorum]